MSTKECHYAVLEVERTAAEDDLKKAYRRQALKWHPDKNPDRLDEANRRFRLIQEAYEILSDPHERAWYDNHRESILNPHKPSTGNAAGSGKRSSGTAASGYFEIIDVMQYFTTSVFEGFDDKNPRSFYCVYRNLFDELRKQEQDAVQSYQNDQNHDYADDDDDGDDGGEAGAARPVLFTTFGDSTADHSALRTFYNFWLNFTTRLSFSWCDQYRLSEAPNRRVRRLMQKENQKLREAGRKEYNESVRQLAQFIQRRDERYTRLQEEAKMANETRAALQARRLAEERAARAAQMMDVFQEQDWMKCDEEALEASLEGRILGDRRPGQQDEGDAADEDDQVEYLDEFYCAACEKAFKSEKQFQNHERSKKHLKKIADLRRQMLLEDEQDLSPVTLSSDIAVNSDDDSNEVFTDARQAIDASDGDCKDDLDEISKRFGGSVDINNSNESINNQPHNKHPFDDGSDVVFDSDKESPPAIVGNEATSKDKKQRKPRRAKNKQQDATELPPMRCNVCNEEFPTRNKLFQHISTTGHALAADQNSGKQKSKKTKRK